jgi:nucleoside-diphosphate-sugar epimerase
MRIIVTGGAGFVGPNLVRALVARGDQVVVDNLATTSSLKLIEDVADRIEFLHGDVRRIRDVPSTTPACPGYPQTVALDPYRATYQAFGVSGTPPPDDDAGDRVHGDALDDRAAADEERQAEDQNGADHRQPGCAGTATAPTAASARPSVSRPATTSSACRMVRREPGARRER